MASGCIKTDTTPLFAPHSGTVSPKQNSPVRKKKVEIKTLAETLDDVLPKPGETPAKAMTSADSTYEYQFIPPKATPKLQPTRGHDGVDEMEWTPTAPVSLPRALKDSPSPGARAFGQAPTREDGGPFYYKTPPAPVDPARKMRNPPNQPAIWSSAEKENGGSFKGFGAQQTMRDGKRPARQGVEFTKQSFFAPRNEHAEDESLAKMLGQTFKLDDEKPSEKKGWLNWR